MKKCLWMTAAAMVLGCGMSAHAVTQAVYGAWSFETLENATVIPSAGDTALADPYGTWSASSNNDDLAYITNAPVGAFPPGYPIAGDHNMALYFNSTEGVTNHFKSTQLFGAPFYTDFLLKAGRLEEDTLLQQVDSDARLAFFFDTNGWFNLIHGSIPSGMVTSRFENVIYNSNDWVRITLVQDHKNPPIFDSDPNYKDLKSMFSIYVNSTNLLHANGYVNAGTNEAPAGINYTGAGDGAWFIMNKDSTLGMNALVALGVGMLDDVVNTDTDPFGGGGEPSFITVLAMSTNNAYGTISPAGFVTITDGVARAFTLTVVDGVAAYVSGLKVDGAQLYTNDIDQTVRTQVWNVSYAQVGGALGTNVVAMFAAKANTTASILDNYFTIDPNGSGPLNYTSFAEANADDWDNDGFSNFDEAVAGTDPTDDTDFLKISSITVDAAGQVVVTFEGSAAALAANYNLMEADTVDQVPYSNVVVRAKDGGTLSVTNTPASSPKFYKVVVPYSGE